MFAYNFGHLNSARDAAGVNLLLRISQSCSEMVKAEEYVGKSMLLG